MEFFVFLLLFVVHHVVSRVFRTRIPLVGACRPKRARQMADNSVKHTEFSGDGQAAMGKNTTNGSTSSSWSAVSSTTICSNSVIVSTKEESGGSPCDDRVVDVAVARDEPVVETVTSERQDDLFHGVALVIKEHLEGEKGLEVLSISANRSRTQEDAFKRLMKKGKTTRGAAEEIGLSSPTLDDLDGGRRLMAVVTEVKLTGLFRQPTRPGSSTGSAAPLDGG